MAKATRSEILSHPLFYIREYPEMRTKIAKLFATVDHAIGVKWAIEIAKHIISVCDIDLSENYDAIAGLYLLCLYTKSDINDFPLVAENLSNLRSIDIKEENITPALLRATGLKLHSSVFADPELEKSAVIRVIAQAISSPFLFEQCLNTADFATLAIGALNKYNIDRITAEREWQFRCLSYIIEEEQRYN